MKKIVMIIMAVALVALPTMAQQQEWKSTSTLQGVSSTTYQVQITEVGATNVPDMATTTESYSPTKAPGVRKGFGPNQDGGQTGDPNSPVGDAVLPLMLMALAFCGVVYSRRRKAKS